VTRLLPLLAAAALAGCVAPGMEAPERPLLLAVTVDDIPEHGELMPGATRAEVGRAIVAALTAEQVPAAGFINGVSVERSPATEEVLADWAAAGLQLGNHSWSHASVDELSVEEYRAEIERNEPLLKRHSPAGSDWHWFRYPYLIEGEEDAKRAGVRALLAERGYRIAAVTMDFSDWAFNDAYMRCARRGDAKRMARLERQFFAAARSAARQSRTMARRLYRRDISYVLLMHMGTIQARLFPQLLAAYRQLGYRFVSLEEAQRDPVYAQDNDPRLTPGPSGLEARMDASGRTPPRLLMPASRLARVCA
jgi:peptidoglycan/xylan/chitin deacetylase (PgdA/CDA1 family)